MSSKKLFVICLFAIIFVIGTMTGSYLFFNSLTNIDKFEKIFAIVNVLFTGLAFSAAGIAVYFQYVQLKETKHSLKDSELTQREVLEAQAKMLEIQRLQAEALIKSKQTEITAILKSSEYNYAISREFTEEIDEILCKINSTAKSVESA